MGGRGSGWQGERKTTVEAGLILDIKKLVAMGALVPGAYRRGSLTSRCGSEFEYELVQLRQDGTRTLWFSDRGSDGKQFMSLHGHARSPPCLITAVGAGGSSAQIKKIRVSKLYLPPGATQFASRKAYNLTYRSSRRAVGENDQKSFGVAWPSDLPVAANTAGGSQG